MMNLNLGMVLDIYELLPKDFIKYIRKDYCKIYYFLSEDITVQERFEIFKEYDTDEHYTHTMDDKKLLGFCERLVRENQYFKEQCIKYNLPFFETSKNRNKVFETFLQTISGDYKIDKK